jgi:hypothetical protein
MDANEHKILQKLVEKRREMESLLPPDAIFKSPFHFLDDDLYIGFPYNSNNSPQVEGYKSTRQWFLAGYKVIRGEVGRKCYWESYGGAVNVCIMYRPDQVRPWKKSTQFVV